MTDTDRETVEKAYIDGRIGAEEAAETLGLERLKDLEYARNALAQDLARGLEMPCTKPIWPWLPPT